MGGTTDAIYWRGVRICACMKAPLDELARITGDDFKVTPIPGFGSYQDGTTASGSTATGGGHIDISLTGYSTAQKLRAEALARMIGFYADIREPKWYSPYFGKWLTASWQSHLHMLLKSCTHLSTGAKTQLAEWYEGENGLAGDDKDDGPRQYLRQTWSQYPSGLGGGRPSRRFRRKRPTRGRRAFRRARSGAAARPASTARCPRRTHRPHRRCWTRRRLLPQARGAAYDRRYVRHPWASCDPPVGTARDVLGASVTLAPGRHPRSPVEADRGR